VHITFIKGTKNKVYNFNIKQYKWQGVKVKTNKSLQFYLFYIGKKLKSIWEGHEELRRVHEWDH